MRTSKFTSYYLIALLISFSCCKNPKTTFVDKKSDTTLMLQHILDTAFSKGNLGDKSKLFKNNPFKDTIIFKYDSLLTKYLPKDKHFKILTEDEICNLACKNNTKKDNDFCSFLEVSLFDKEDSIFSLCLHNTCVLPLYNDKGEKSLTNSSFYKNDNKCMFGMLCGAGVGLRFIKQADSIKVISVSFSSD